MTKARPALSPFVIRIVSVALRPILGYWRRPRFRIIGSELLLVNWLAPAVCQQCEDGSRASGDL